MEPTQDWTDEPTQEVSLEEMDKIIAEMLEAKEEHTKAKKETSALHADFVTKQEQAVKILKAAGKKSYKVDGLGTLTIINKSMVCVPPTIEAKRELFKWIEDKHGKDYLDSLVGIHSGKLNSFYKEEFEKAEDPSMFNIPGLAEPTMKQEARFTKQK